MCDGSVPTHAYHFHLAHILAWNNADELIRNWLPEHSHYSTLMRLYLMHDMAQNLQLGHCWPKIEMLYRHQIWLIEFRPFWISFQTP